jgi:DNA polymerase-3 subunit epsilon
MWEECAWSGYGLTEVCKKIGYEFRCHDALEDAKASGQVLLAAIAASGMDINAWLRRVRQPIDPATSSKGSAVNREGNPEGELYGEVIVFTGALEIPRSEAADLAARIGCSVDSGVTKKTTLLVVGDQDVSRLAGKEKSSKHLKAEQLITQGQSIRILRESDFKELVNQAQRMA